MTGSVSEVTKIRESGRILILPRMKARDRSRYWLVRASLSLTSALHIIARILWRDILSVKNNGAPHDVPPGRRGLGATSSPVARSGPPDGTSHVALAIRVKRLPTSDIFG